jgi:hypothetical protein
MHGVATRRPAPRGGTSLRSALASAIARQANVLRRIDWSWELLGISVGKHCGTAALAPDSPSETVLALSHCAPRLATLSDIA